MEKIRKYLTIGILASLILGGLGEFILCFIRGYSELWYTILAMDVLVSIFLVIAVLKKKIWPTYVSTGFLLAGAILLATFPYYVMYLAFICGGLSLVAEIVLTVLKKK